MSDESSHLLSLKLMRDFQLADETCMKRLDEPDESAMLSAYARLRAAYDALNQSDDISFSTKWSAMTSFDETSLLVGLKRTKSPEAIRANAELAERIYRML